MQNKQIIPCEVVIDLQPLYMDDITSEQTRNHIEMHLEKCESCRKVYDEYAKDYQFVGEVLNEQKKDTVEQFSKYLRKEKKRKTEKTIITSVVTFLLTCLLIYGISEAYIIPISDKIFNISEAYVVSNETTTELFIWFDEGGRYYTPVESHITMKKKNKDEMVLSFNLRRCLLSTACNEWDIQYTHVYLEQVPNKIWLGGKVIWQKEKQKDEIPEYITYYIYHPWINMRKNESNEIIITENDDSRYIWDEKTNTLVEYCE